MDEEEDYGSADAYFDLCERCEHNANISPASKYCPYCEESHCKSCTDFHRACSLTRSHHLLGINERRTLQAAEIGAMSLTCNICIKVSKKCVPATKYCEECNEQLCSTCTTVHKSQHATKYHQPRDLNININRDPIMCKFCVSTPATNFCEICPEAYCAKCSTRHGIQNATKTHRVKLISDYSAFRTNEAKECMRQEATVANTTPTRKKDKPGKPLAVKIKADSIELSWEKPVSFTENDSYQIRYKDVDSNDRWTFISTEYTSSTAKLVDMKANTKFIFQIRMIHNELEGPYSETSDVIHTPVSPGEKFLMFSTLREVCSPSKYALPLTEIGYARCEEAKLKKVELGSSPPLATEEKTIMLVGATGTGKTTIVDSIVNYILGVRWNDPYRFTIVDLEKEEKTRSLNQAQSQTEWITCYTIYPDKGTRLDYKLTIIDTPGFGDTRGLEQDKNVAQQIYTLFSGKDEKGVVMIDAICFFIKAPDARLTPTQSFIFQSIVSIFGKNINDNFCYFITFADGKQPPVLAALKEAKLPSGTEYMFNNVCLFSGNTELESSSVSSKFWEMGLKSYRSFFNNLDKMETRSLNLTKQVLDERQTLERTVATLQSQVGLGLSKVQALYNEIDTMQKHKSDINDNKDFEYETLETRLHKKEVPHGDNVTNCTSCKVTCHKKCRGTTKISTRFCSSMNLIGNCKVCPQQCSWKQHENESYMIEYVTKPVNIMYSDKLEKYAEAAGKLLTAREVVAKIQESIKYVEVCIISLIEKMNESTNRLREIALRPNPLSMTEHIKLMIENEKLEMKDGFQDRINFLMKCINKAELPADAELFKKEAQESIRYARKENDLKLFHFDFMNVCVEDD